jgi:N-acetylmuramoyl-L-alanine amidase
MGLLILDAGHGGVRPNGVYTTSPAKLWVHREGVFHAGRTFYEGVYNRAVCKRIIELAKSYSLPVIKVYDDVEDISLGERCRIVNKIVKIQKNCVFISIHGNAFTNLNSRGISVHAHPSLSVGTARLADALGQNLRKVKETPFRVQNTTDLFWKDNFQVLRETNCPAILSENGFFTNYQDATLMMTADFQDKIARAHVEAVVRYFN